MMGAARSNFRSRTRDWLSATSFFRVYASKPGVWLLLASPLLFALAAVALGKEAGWDLQNYHWYNPYALLHRRLGFDIAVAHHATYYNPLIDMPSYWLASHGPAWWVGAFHGGLFGVMVALLGSIAYQVLCYQLTTQQLTIARVNMGGSSARLLMAVLIAICGATGAGAILALGDPGNDVPSAIGIFAALWMLLRYYPQLRSDEITWQSSLMLLLAGLCAGASAGLKLTTDTYALGLLVATFMTPATWSKRCAATALLGTGMLCGFLIMAGWWFWRMWEYGQNPLFPYFNQWFHSPLLVDGSYRDPTYITRSSGYEKWLLPWFMTHDSSRVSELQFRDARMFVAYGLVLIASAFMLVGWVRSKRGTRVTPVAHTGIATFLFCFAAVTYLAWLNMFCIYRYLVPLEMLAPLLITVAILLLPLTLTLQVAVLLGIWATLQAALSVKPVRQNWDGSYISVNVPQQMVKPDSMVLMSGSAPMAFVIPSFPGEVRFLRIDGWTVPRDDVSSGLARQMHAAVAHHDGPLLMLFFPAEQMRAVLAAQAYGLRLVMPSCAAVTSNIAEPLRLCNLAR